VTEYQPIAHGTCSAASSADIPKLACVKLPKEGSRGASSGCECAHCIVSWGLASIKLM
jgi:hypothetical protein